MPSLRAKKVQEDLLVLQMIETLSARWGVCVGGEITMLNIYLVFVHFITALFYKLATPR